MKHENDVKVLTLGGLQECTPALKKIFESDLPIRVSYTISKTIDCLEKENLRFIKLYNKICNCYGEKNQKGYKIHTEKMDKFQYELNELLALRVKDISIEPISLGLLEDIGIVLKPIEVKSLIDYGFLNLN